MSESILRNASLETDNNILRGDKLRVFLSSGDKDSIFRSLTPGEIELAESIFQSTIKYNKVKIYRGGYQSELQPKIMTQPRSGGVILTINEYRDDFSANYTDYHDSLRGGVYLYVQCLSSGNIIDLIRLFVMLMHRLIHLNIISMNRILIFIQWNNRLLLLLITGC